MKLNKLIKKINKENTPPDGWKPEDDINKAINWEKLEDPEVIKQLEENINLFYVRDLNNNELEMVRKTFKNIPKNLIDPRIW